MGKGLLKSDWALPGWRFSCWPGHHVVSCMEGPYGKDLRAASCCWEQPLADSQQEYGDLHSTTTRNWMLLMASELGRVPQASVEGTTSNILISASKNPEQKTKQKCVRLLTHRNYDLKICGTSLVAQWLRIRLPMQGTWVWSLVWEDPTCRRATKPVRHEYWACALKPANHNYWSLRA